jgi:hypothetical protein
MRIGQFRYRSVPMACLRVAALLLVANSGAHAQNVQFLPETDVYLKLNPSWRTYVQAKNDQDAGGSPELSIGPSIQLYVKPLLRLKQVTVFDLDDSKKRALVLETGYRYITAPDTVPENRLEAIATSHFPMKAQFLISERNRADLDWKNGQLTWRYRNKLTIERTFAVHSYHLIPYAAAEPYYESQYAKWSTTDLYAGCLFPVGKYVQFDPYYKHENNTGKPPNQQQNAIGLAVYFFLSMEHN